jgi:putative transcriptional regulator
MSKNSTFVRYRKPPVGARVSPEDLEYHRNLTEEQIHAAAVSDPDNPPLTDERLAQMRLVPLARVARLRTGLDQAAFADAFGFTAAQLDDLEAGRIEPDQVMARYLTIIRTNPERLLALVSELRGAKAA